MGDSDSGYQFGSGIGEDEVARLEVQGAALAPPDADDPRRGGHPARHAGAGSGLRGGVVAFVAAQAWSDPEAPWSASTARADALARARLRAGQRGLAPVRPLLAPGQVSPTLAEFLCLNRDPSSAPSISVLDAADPPYSTPLDGPVSILHSAAFPH